MDESDARRALMALGIIPTRGLIRSWLQAARAEEALEQSLANHPCKSGRPPVEPPPVAPEAYQAPRPRGYSKSNLEPVLRAQGTLERTSGRRKRGRPRIIARWFPEVAETMADGTSLNTALAMHGITNLNKTEVRACYRNRTFRALYKEARRKFLAKNQQSYEGTLLCP